MTYFRDAAWVTLSGRFPWRSAGAAFRDAFPWRCIGHNVCNQLLDIGHVIVYHYHCRLSTIEHFIIQLWKTILKMNLWIILKYWLMLTIVIPYSSWHWFYLLSNTVDKSQDPCSFLTTSRSSHYCSERMTQQYHVGDGVLAYTLELELNSEVHCVSKKYPPFDCL